MSPERFDELMRDDTAALTSEELSKGWHFCVEYDGLLMRVGTRGCICDMPCGDA